MSELSPGLKRLIAATRASISPDERALTALRADLDARLGHTTGSESAGVRDAPLDFVARHGLAKILVSVVALAVIGVSGRLLLERRREHVTVTLSHVTVPLERARATPTRAEPAQPAIAAPSLQPTAASVDVPRARPLRSKRVEQRARSAIKLVPPTRPSTPVQAQPTTTLSVPASETRPGSSEDPLERELEVLHAARSALERGDATAAVALLDQHDRRYPTGPLRQERLATRVLALCELGRVRDAHATAGQLLRVAPRALYTARLRRSCVSDLVE